MSKKSASVVCLVLSFGVMASAARANLTTGLVGYWPLDGDAVDASGNGNNGTVVGNVTPVADRFGTPSAAMKFPNSTSAYIDLGQPPMLLIKGAMTVAAWVRADTLAQSGRIIAKQGPSSGRSWGLNVETDGYARFDLGTDPTTRIRADSAVLSFGPTDWWHIAGVFRPGQAVELYINGQMVKSQPTTVTTQWIENGLPVNIGRRPEPGTPWRGDIDEVVMYNVALAPADVLRLATSGIFAFPKARKPNPADGAVREDTWVSLAWTAGAFAASHDVYLGDSFDDVNAGTAGTFRGNQTATTYVAGIAGFAYPDGLVPGTTYYWRIDEVNNADPNSPWKGDIWSFSIPSRKAYHPNPPDGAKYVATEGTILSWTAGMDAKLHTIYFGDNSDTVSNAAGGGFQATATFNPGKLASGKTYYWRVDEFDGAATYKGDLWSFQTRPDMPIADPNLLGWWKLDEGYGTVALDWSGHASDGVLEGDPQWVPGYDGDALELDGAGDNINIASAQLAGRAFTVALWLNPAAALNATSTRQDLLYWQQPNGRPHLTFNRSGYGEIGLWPNIDGDFDGPQTSTRAWAANTWYHVAGTFDGTAFTIYVNGAAENVVYHAGIHTAASGLLIGARTSQRNYFTGKIDDVRHYNKALTQQEISLVMRGDLSLAWAPKPGNGSTPNLRDALPLGWSPGNRAAQHDVYFGTSRDAVGNANASDTTGVYRGRQSTTSYTPPEGVQWGGGPYYWRIDQVNTDGTIGAGRVWSFTVADFVLIDDFERYDAGTNQIWWAWKDGLGYAAHDNQPAYAGNGTGSAIGDDTTPSFTEETIVHSGGKSMPFTYDNTQQGKSKYSAGDLTLTSVRDWTADGVAELSLWLRGDAANSTERMYVALNGTATVYHTNPNVTQTAAWTEWVIPLKQFADQGANLTNVTSISIGIGTRGNTTTPGGAGKMYFDDIRLYRARTAP